MPTDSENIAEAYMRVGQNKNKIISESKEPDSIDCKNKSKKMDDTDDTDNDKQSKKKPVKEAACKMKNKSNKKKVAKTKKKDINNLKENSMIKSKFDQLYSKLLRESNEEERELGITTDTSTSDYEMDDTDEYDDMGDEMGDDEMGDVTITLSPTQVDTLREILNQVDGDSEGEEDEDGGMGEDGYLDDEDSLSSDEEDEFYNEDTKYTTDGSKLGVDPSGMTKGSIKKTDLPGDVLGGKTSGTGNAKVTDKTGNTSTSDGKKLGHDPSGMSKKKSLKK
jgi:hypothetical protein